MKATHTDYKHPRHLRVEDGGRVYCVSPSAASYTKLNRSGLKSWNDVPADEQERLNR